MQAVVDELQEVNEQLQAEKEKIEKHKKTSI